MAMLCRGRVMRFLVPATQQQLAKATSFITPFSLEWYPKPTSLFSNNPFQELVSSSSPAAVTTSGFAVRTARMSFSSDQGGQDGRFKLSESSTLLIKKGDITKWFVDGSSDAIVNPANERMLGGGGADGAIHKAAGPELVEACYKVPEVQPGVRCPTGEARITPGFKLPASRVIHTVGPIYDSNSNPEIFLKNAYKNSLTVAKENSIQYIAFTAISCGVYGYPLEEAAAIAISTVKEFANDFKEVHFVLFSDEIYSVWLNKATELLGA
ncbi:macro domain-containing protein VPA0103-like [Mangifera indica]|uniref:macro domain-containing protein VPA0103-like n=1 Tax=Mangifera indica TaxID=29780 RepID=UPI001CFAFCB7|nr:macro domain-containing protein VPA0103-like [Mangifera indica]